MAIPTDEYVYVLDIDASIHFIGAVLSQVQAAEEREIAYGSRANNRAEAYYCKTQKDLLPVMYLMKFIKQYLLGREFLESTDHASLI